MVEVGLVDSVDVDEDNDRIWVTVFAAPGRETIRCPFVTPSSDIIVVPEEKQIVEVHEIEPGQYVARNPHTTPSHGIPAGLGTGDIAFTLNSGTSLTFTKNDDGTYDIDISADGNITIDGIDFDAHTHDYTDIDDTGTTQNKTTDPPN